ncbi:MAG: AAA family ATPase [Acidimicrobiales bacterium]
MRIAGWRIDGFGIFSDASVDDLPPGLTLVTGPNEAGKSTLLAFLRGVLFGFPDGRMRARRHEPINGGRHGGAVFLVDESGGTWTAERYVDPKTFTLRRPDGSTAEPGELARLLGSADSTLFANVFAFGLTELDAFEFIDSDAVRERIFSAGVVGAGRSARDALSTLDARRQSLARPRGKCEIRELTEQARNVSRELSQAQAAAADLARRRGDVDRLAEEAEAKREAVEGCRQEQQRLRSLLEVWPVRSRIADIDAELDTLKVPDGLDGTTEARFERVTTELAAAQRALDEATVAAGAAQKKRDAIRTDDQLSSVAPEVRTLLGEIALEEGRRTRLAELAHAIDSQRELLDEQLATLGPDWDRHQLAQFDASIPAAEEVRRRGHRLEDMEHRLERLQSERVALARSRAETQAKLAAIEQQNEGTPRLPSAEDAARESRALRQLRAHLVDLGTQSARLEGANRTLAGLKAVAPASANAGKSSRAGAVVIGVLGAVVAALGVVALIGGSTSVAGVLGAGGVAMMVIAAIVFVGGRSLTRHSSEAAVTRQIVEAEQAAAEAQDKVEVLRTSVRATALQLGLTAEPTAIEVEECAARIERSNQELRDALQRRTRATELTSDIKDATKRLDELETEIASLSGKVAREQEEWEAWKKERQVPPDLGIEAINDLFTAIERARSTLRSLQGVERERDEVAAEADAWRSRARAVLDRVHDDLPDDNVDLISRIRTLAERIEADDASRRSLEERISAWEEANQRAELAKERLDSAAAEHAGLLRIVGADDDAQFREALERRRRRVELEAERQGAMERIHAALGRGEAAQPLLAELESGDRGGWDAALNDAAARLPELEAEHEAAIRRHHDADRALDELARSADVADAALRLESVQARLADRVTEWQTLTAARTLIADTLARYERERQPAVLSRAETMFERVTAGHYPHLVIADGEVRVVDHAGRQLSTVDLSRGTAEQLYLCVRFGLAAEFASHTPLPFVMDDVLVNFDPERTEAMAGVVAELAESHQVLLFSCQPASIGTMREARPDARVIELPRHGGKPKRSRRSRG